ncbi:MAG: DUF6057 family protein [Tannerellaceae bacterium]|jgi:hypothetical protein|nr:DUF6057 family protein [Tannerellaceae bacterium]
MKNQLSVTYLNGLLSLVFGLSVFLFFGYFYSCHLLYQEQYQMFLFTSAYMMETIYRPGGLAEYIARFLTQFYYVPWHGALIIAFLLTLMQRQIRAVVRHTGGRKAVWEPLSFLPPLFYWVLLCDENYMLTGVVSLAGVLLAFQGGLLIRTAPFRLAYRLLLIPVLYVLTGGTALVFALLCIVSELGKGESGTGRRFFFMAGAALLLLLLTPLSASYVFTQYPLAKLWTGANYYRFPTLFPFPLLLLWLSVPGLAVLFKYLPAGGMGRMRSALVHTLWQLAALVFVTVWGLSRTADWEKEEVMRYDYCVRSGQWERLIRLADEKAPGSPLSVSFLNLALCKQGLLPDRMFHYFQNGPEGLLPSFVRDFSLPMMAGELYYHLGFINTAQRFTFEAIEAIPDFQRSSRGIRRLAETNLLNGDYEVARKYLHLLQQTLYYRQWATETLACLSDEKQIEARPDWARLRKYRTKTDFFFSEGEKDMMLGILLQQDLSNRPAYEYLMAYCLLTKDLEHFYQYYPLGENIPYQTLPVSYQEALVYLWGLSNRTMDHIPYPVSNEVKQRVQEYRRIYVGYTHAEPMLRKQFSDTYWYYFHFRK